MCVGGKLKQQLPTTYWQLAWDRAVSLLLHLCLALRHPLFYYSTSAFRIHWNPLKSKGQWRTLFEGVSSNLKWLCNQQNKTASQISYQLLRGKSIPKGRSVPAVECTGYENNNLETHNNFNLTFKARVLVSKCSGSVDHGFWEILALMSCSLFVPCKGAHGPWLLSSAVLK